MKYYIQTGLLLTALATNAATTIFSGWGALRTVQKLYFMNDNYVHVPTSIFYAFVAMSLVSISLGFYCGRQAGGSVRYLLVALTALVVTSGALTLTLYLVGYVIVD